MFMEGETCSINPLEIDHYQRVWEWMMDPEVTKYMFYGQRPQTLEDTEKFISDGLSGENDLFVIRTSMENEIGPCDELVGFTGLYSISLTARSAEFRILIGNKEQWGKGIGTEVTREPE